MVDAQARRILVTGGSSGIGAAICRRLAAPGVAILVHARANREGADGVAAAVREAGGQAEVVLADLADPASAPALVAHMVEAFGGLDVLISNAGFSDSRPFGVIDAAGVDRAQAAIAAAFFGLADAALPHLRASTAGRVVAVSSLGAHVFRSDTPSFPATAAAKAALEAMARSLAVTLAPEGITVNCVVPGFIEKDPGTHSGMNAEQWAMVQARIPAARLGRTAEVAALVAFLVGPDAGYVTGQRIHVNGGLV